MASFNIWVKYDESEPVKVKFGGEDVDDLKAAIKRKLANKLGEVDADDIRLQKHEEEKDLEPDCSVDRTFGPTARKPLKVVVVRGK